MKSTGRSSSKARRRRGRRRIGPVDRIIAATGQRPDLSLTRELRLDLDPWLESTKALGPLIDPNEHSCGSVPPHGHRELAHPEPGFYTVGIKSYGRAPTFLLLTGYEQVRSVAAAIAGDMAAADDLRLVLPETGVCTTERIAIDRRSRRLLRRTGAGRGRCLLRGRRWSQRTKANPDAVAGLLHERPRRGNSFSCGKSTRPCDRRHDPRGDADPRLGLVLLSPGGSGAADRPRYRLAVRLGCRGIVPRPADGRPRIAARRRQHSAPRRASGPRGQCRCCWPSA